MQPKVKRALDRAIEAEGLSPELGQLLHSVLLTETRGRHTDKRGNVIRGGAGEYGAAQLMPRTAEDVGVTDPTDVNQNVLGAARYLKRMHSRYQDHPDAMQLTLAAYNTGPGNVDRAMQRAGGPASRYDDIKNYIARSTREHYVPNTLKRFQRLGGSIEAMPTTDPQPVEGQSMEPVTQNMGGGTGDQDFGAMLQQMAQNDPRLAQMFQAYAQIANTQVGPQPVGGGMAQPDPAAQPAPAARQPIPRVSRTAGNPFAAPPPGGSVDEAQASAPVDEAQEFAQIIEARRQQRDASRQEARDLGLGFGADLFSEFATLGGMTDPLVAAGAALFTPVDRDRPFSERYRDILETRRQQAEQFREDNPVSTFVAGAAPAAVVGGLGTSALMRGAGLGARTAGTLAATGEGALYGAGHSEGAATGDMGQLLGDAARAGALSGATAIGTMGLVDGARIGGRATRDAIGGPARMQSIRPRPDGPHLTDRIQAGAGSALDAVGDVIERPGSLLPRVGLGRVANAIPRVPGVPSGGALGGLAGGLAGGIPGMLGGIAMNAARPSLGRAVRAAGTNLRAAAQRRGGMGPFQNMRGQPGAPPPPAAARVTQEAAEEVTQTGTPPPFVRSQRPVRDSVTDVGPPTMAGRVSRGAGGVVEVPPGTATQGFEPTALRASAPPPPLPTRSAAELAQDTARRRLFEEPSLPPDIADEAAEAVAKAADGRLTAEQRLKLMDPDIAEDILGGRTPRPRGNQNATNPGRGQAPRAQPDNRARMLEEPEMPPEVAADMDRVPRRATPEVTRDFRAPAQAVEVTRPSGGGPLSPVAPAAPTAPQPPATTGPQPNRSPMGVPPSVTGVFEPTGQLAAPPSAPTTGTGPRGLPPPAVMQMLRSAPRARALPPPGTRSLSAPQERARQSRPGLTGGPLTDDYDFLDDADMGTQTLAELYSRFPMRLMRSEFDRLMGRD